MPRREILGVAAAASSSLLGGTAVAATRFIVASTDPASLALARYGIGSLYLIILLRGALQRPRRVDLIPILSLGVLFFAVFPRLFNKSLAWTAAARGSLALSALPLLTLAVAAALGVERLTVRKFSSVAMALLGVATALGDKLAAPASKALGAAISSWSVPLCAERSTTCWRGSISSDTQHSFSPPLQCSAAPRALPF